MEQQEQNPFTSRKVLIKFEAQVFNFAVKSEMHESDPPLTQGSALKKVSEQWQQESYRKNKTTQYLEARAEKVSRQLEQIDLCLDALKV